MTPLIFGHAGAQAYRPGNTLPAFELAIAQGADGIELDVHRSKDGHGVVLHDFTVDRETDGTGRVADLTLDQLQALDAGFRFDLAWAGTRIPTLDAVLALARPGLWFNIEIKSQSEQTDGIEAAVAACIDRHRLRDQVIVSSFNPLALRRFREIMPDVALGFLHGLESPPVVHALMAGFVCPFYHPEAALIDAALMAKAQAEGQRVIAWTVNAPEEARRLRDLGVYGIITDAPDRLRAALADDP